VAMGQIHYRTGFGNRGGYGRTATFVCKSLILSEYIIFHFA
jgi:hypothetical protein